jgi:hypothetical protein
MGRHPRSPSINSSDDENSNPNASPRKRRKTGKNAAASSNTDASDMKELMAVLKANEERRAKFEGKIVQALEDSTAVYSKAQEKFIGVLMDKLN